MDKYKVDYSEFSPFKGITIDFNHLEEGLNYACEHNIKDVFVRTDNYKSKAVVDFSILKGYSFIQTFHWAVPLSKRTDITGLYHLSELRNIRWGETGNFAFDLSYFPLLEVANIGFGSKIIGWEKSLCLKRLILGQVKTDDLFFLHNVFNLEYLRITRGTFTSISGIENCNKLRTLFLQMCTSLTKLKPTINTLSSLEQLNLEGCRKIDINKELDGIGIKYLSVM